MCKRKLFWCYFTDFGHVIAELTSDKCNVLWEMKTSDGVDVKISGLSLPCNIPVILRQYLQKSLFQSKYVIKHLQTFSGGYNLDPSVSCLSVRKLLKFFTLFSHNIYFSVRKSQTFVINLNRLVINLQNEIKRFDKTIIHLLQTITSQTEAEIIAAINGNIVRHFQHRTQRKFRFSFVHW